MGGYGAIHTALTYPDDFCACIALSSAIHMEDMAAAIRAGTEDVIPLEMAKLIFEDPDCLVSSNMNPQVQYCELKENGQQIPYMYLACGTEDDLCEANRSFADFLRAEGAAFDYDEGPGKHDWFFWNEYLDRGIRCAFGERFIAFHDTDEG